MSFMYFKPKEIELGFHMGVTMPDTEIDLEDISIPGVNGIAGNAPFQAKFKLKAADFDDISKASRMGKVFQEQPFKEATIYHPYVSDTMKKRRLKGEDGHPPRDSNKTRLKKIEPTRVSHRITGMNFTGGSCWQDWETSGPMGEQFAKDIIFGKEVPAGSIRIFSTARKVVDKARGIRMSVGPYQYITTDKVYTPSNSTAEGEFSPEEAARIEGIRKAMIPNYEQESYETTFKIGRDMLFEGSDDVKTMVEYMGVELEGFEDGYATFKDGDNARLFLNVEDKVKYDITRMKGTMRNVFR